MHSLSTLLLCSLLAAGGAKAEMPSDPVTPVAHHAASASSLQAKAVSHSGFFLEPATLGYGAAGAFFLASIIIARRREARRQNA